MSDLVPCGQNLGHGITCVAGYLCSSCKKINELEEKLLIAQTLNTIRWKDIRKLNAKIEWITKELDALELHDVDDVAEMSHSTDGCKWIEDFMILRILDKLEKNDEWQYV